MTRLTKGVREQVANAMIKARFEGLLPPLAERSAALFIRVYESVYDEGIRKLMAQLQKRHRTMFQHKTCIQTNCGGMRMNVGEIRLGGSGVWKRVEVKPLPFANHDESSAFTFVDCELSQAIRAFHSDHEAVKKQIEDAHTKVIGALSSMSTIRQVEENWPEALPIFDNFMPTPGVTSNVPAVRFEELTDFLGLKKETVQ